MAGGKRVAKKAFEDGHGISERETKRTDKPRYLCFVCSFFSSCSQKVLKNKLFGTECE
jgi:hypothetical protein